jgi:hypothetical protein
MVEYGEAGRLDGVALRLRGRGYGHPRQLFPDRLLHLSVQLPGGWGCVREETDLTTLSEKLIGVARETMQPEHVSLWLRPSTASKSQRTD